MNTYFSTGTIKLDTFDDLDISEKYNQGFVLTRVAKGHMNQTRSLRIDLSKFELSSENRRILRKSEGVNLEVKKLPLENYTWKIHQLGKTFYTQKFGDGTMSATKIKEMFNDMEQSNMNYVFEFSQFQAEQKEIVGYCLAYINSEIIHYAYPFYNLEIPKEQNIGITMMTKAIAWAKENSKKYVYLGSVVDSESKYKLQFNGEEWWDENSKTWSSDIAELKALIG